MGDKPDYVCPWRVPRLAGSGVVIEQTPGCSSERLSHDDGHPSEHAGPRAVGLAFFSFEVSSGQQAGVRDENRENDDLAGFVM